jgi:hypothetical protein
MTKNNCGSYVGLFSGKMSIKCYIIQMQIHTLEISLNKLDKDWYQVWQKDIIRHTIFTK